MKNRPEDLIRMATRSALFNFCSKKVAKTSHGALK